MVPPTFCFRYQFCPGIRNIEPKGLHQFLLIQGSLFNSVSSLPGGEAGTVPGWIQEVVYPGGAPQPSYFPIPWRLTGCHCWTSDAYYWRGNWLWQDHSNPTVFVRRGNSIGKERINCRSEADPCWSLREGNAASLVPTSCSGLVFWKQQGPVPSLCNHRPAYHIKIQSTLQFGFPETELRLPLAGLQLSCSLSLPQCLFLEIMVVTGPWLLRFWTGIVLSYKQNSRRFQFLKHLVHEDFFS